MLEARLEKAQDLKKVSLPHPVPDAALRHRGAN